ncbi:hypothetical protein [Modestobacter sp. Leaf380]|uniref:hypothetical protein n=1 Tax=Modestobacter sp. Leaf380 TaxID=1736356 RepID=UPI0006FD5138|nr:hypothetical protein [Modestobacter sp. Leaf380]KQS69153.1 hypothetical protein ASG41_22010 [Modestobacter sp. Leaf380]
MALITCPECSSEDITGTPQPDSRLLIHCAACGHEWLRGEARRDPARPHARTAETLAAEFPQAADVRPDVRERIAALEAEFLTVEREPDPDAEGFATRYREQFAAENLRDASPEVLLHFVTSPTVANCGNTSGFTRAWKTAGDHTAAQGVRASINHLLYGTESLTLEDRFTQLVEGKKGIGFASFKEPMLAKVLTVVQPDRFLPLLRYSAAADGKKELTKEVFGLDLPPVDKSAFTVGRVAVWSNDLLRSLVGLESTADTAAFLRWAKGRPAS